MLDDWKKLSGGSVEPDSFVTERFQNIHEFMLEDYQKEIYKGMTYKFVPNSNTAITFDFTPKAKPYMEKVVFFDRTCRVFWSDGVTSEATCMPNDFYDREGILGIAIAKRFLGSYTPMCEVLEEMSESNGNMVYIKKTLAQKAEIKRQKRLAIEKEKRIAAEKERQEINARRRDKRMKKAEEEYAKWVAENAKKEKE